jgi:hypothetical protein
MKKRGARQTWDDEQIARAVEYTTSRFLGRGVFDTRRFTDLASAIADAQGDRRAILYAVTPEGFTIHIANGDNMTSITQAEDFALTSPEAVAADLDSAARDIGFDNNDAAVAAADAAVAKPAKAPKAKTAKAPKAAKPAKAPKAAKAVKEPKAPKEPKVKEPGKREAAFAEATASAQRGVLPVAPDFSAPTHKAFRKKLETLVAAAKAGDVDALKADTTEPKSSSRAILCRWRDLTVTALEAKAAKKAAKAAA